MPGEKRKGKDIADEYSKIMAGEAAEHRRTGRGRGGDGRPMMASDCKDLREAERFRAQIQGDIHKKISEIQNSSLGEYRLRELNDEINKVVRVRGHWNRQIKFLGGPDHALSGSKEDGGVRPRGGGGYAYYGAAKNLPGVRELFELETQGPVKRTRADLYKQITPDYYGFRDEDDGVLGRLERRAEQKTRSRRVTEQKAALNPALGVFQFKHDVDDTAAAESMRVPSQAEVERRMLALKKKQLLARYGIADLAVWQHPFLRLPPPPRCCALVVLLPLSPMQAFDADAEKRASDAEEPAAVVQGPSARRTPTPTPHPPSPTPER